MAPKSRPSAATSSSSTSTPSMPSTSSTSTPTPSRPATKSSSTSNQNAQDIVQTIWSKYLQQTPQRVKLLDVFLAFLVAVGVLQFVYCVIVGNFPFNAFLAGFSATVGQFVLTASLRIQTNPQNEKEFRGISAERAFADFVVGSLLLHFFCVNFIN